MLYHAPVFVLTHHAHEPIEMEGGTTFHFVTDGFDAAYAQARRRPVTTVWTSRAAPPPFGRRSSPGSSTSSRSISPRSCSGPAKWIFDGVGSLALEPVEVLHSPLATHIRYRRAS